MSHNALLLSLLFVPNAVGLVLASIGGFFQNLSNEVTGFAVAATIFFLGVGGILYGASGLTGDQRLRSLAQGALYIALAGLAITLLSPTIADLIKAAANGQ